MCWGPLLGVEVNQRWTKHRTQPWVRSVPEWTEASCLHTSCLSEIRAEPLWRKLTSCRTFMCNVWHSIRKYQVNQETESRGGGNPKLEIDMLIAQYWNYKTYEEFVILAQSIWERPARLNDDQIEMQEHPERGGWSRAGDHRQQHQNKVIQTKLQQIISFLVQQ